jgi:cell division protein ZapA (FtsZ GTPase activity inhibitor)
MAALNLSNELLQLHQQFNGVPAGIDARLQALNGRIEAVLQE